jgi:hypothetical protein
MEKDEYVVNKLGIFVCYYKNGKLHREVGPAIYFSNDSHKYTNLEDQELYKRGIVNAGSLPSSVVFNMNKNNDPYYYLEGVSYTENEFKSMLDKKNLKLELDNDLNQNTKEQSRGLKI